MNFVIPRTVYPFDIMVSVGETDEVLMKNFRRYYSRRGFEAPDAQEHLRLRGRGRTVQFRSGFTVIRMICKPETPEDFGILAHEVSHAVHYVLDRVGLKLSKKTSEAWGYYTAHVTQQIYKRLS